MDSSGAVKLVDNSLRKLQRIYETSDFYSRGRGRYDSVMLHAGTTNENDCATHQVWFAKVLGIITFKCGVVMKPGSTICKIHNKDQCTKCENLKNKSMVFVKFYEVLNKDVLPIDAIDDKLNCVRLTWEKHGTADSEGQRGNMYALCGIDTIRGRVQVIDAKNTISLLHPDVEYKSKMHERVGDGPLHYDFFYVNRFHRDDDPTITKE